LPRIFRQRIQESVNPKAGPIEESSINGLVKIIQDAHAEISTRFRLNLNARGDTQTTTAESTPKDRNDTVNQQFVTTFSAAESSERICPPAPQRGGSVSSVDLAPLAFGFPFHQTSNADSGYTTIGYKLDRGLEPFQASTLSIASTDEGPGASLTNRREMATEGNVETRDIQDKPSLINDQKTSDLIPASL
jgi:hypothetical protein